MNKLLFIKMIIKINNLFTIKIEKKIKICHFYLEMSLKEKFTWVNGIKILSKVEEQKLMRMEINTKDIGKIIKNVVKDD